jgi:hypothetical protein
MGDNHLKTEVPSRNWQHSVKQFFACLFFLKLLYYDRGNGMAAKIKPVEPTVIKDKKIIREVIAQIRRKPSAEDVRWAKERRKLFNELTAK